jgi:hypothetical protein
LNTHYPIDVLQRESSISRPCEGWQSSARAIEISMEETMTPGRLYKFCCVGLVLALAGAMLAGCKSNSSTPAAASQSAGGAYTSKTFTTSYTGALDASSQLMLGMLKLEGTDNAITAEQAKTMLRVMQSFQGQVLKSDAERTAVWANVEAQLTPAQSSAIANLRLTQDDLQTWLQSNSQGPGAAPQGMPGGAGPQGTPGAGQGGPRPQGTPGAGPGGAGPQGIPGAASGGARPQGTPGARPASGGAAGGTGAGMGQSNVLLNALIRSLMSKSAGAAAPPSGSPAATPAPAPTNP